MPPVMPATAIAMQEGWGPGLFDLMALTVWSVRLARAPSRRQRRLARQRAMAVLRRYWLPRLARRGIGRAAGQTLVTAIWLGANLQGRLWAKRAAADGGLGWRLLAAALGRRTLLGAAVAYRSWKWAPPATVAAARPPWRQRLVP
jgi:hypothetical protein